MNNTKLRILRVSQEIGDPLLRHIEQRLADVPREEVSENVRQLVRDGLLRMKEDSYDHDWSYILTNAGKSAIAKAGGAL